MTSHPAVAAGTASVGTVVPASPAVATPIAAGPAAASSLAASAAASTAGEPGDRFDVGIIGFGRVGAAYAGALAQAGHRIVAVHARSAARRDVARRRFPGTLADTPAGVGRAAGIVFVTVSDGAIGDVVEGLVRERALRPGQVVAHASGRHGLALLDRAATVGAARAAIHPVMTLPGGTDDAALLHGAAFGVAADPAAAGVVTRLASDMGGWAVQVPDEARVRYHAGLVFDANFLATLVAGAVGLLGAAGVADPASVIAPLLHASLDKALAQGEAAMTGPVRRGDAETLQAHMAELLRECPDLVDAYLALSALTADRLERAGAVPTGLAASVRATLAATLAAGADSRADAGADPSAI